MGGYLRDGLGAAGVPSDLITDASPDSRAVIQADSFAAIRQLLGIGDIGDLRAYGISRAKTLFGLSGTDRPTVVIDDPCLPTTGRIFTGTAGAGTTGYRTDRTGGWVQISTTATAGRDRNLHNAEMNTGGGTGCVVDNVGGRKWYQLWLFSVDTTVDASCFLEMGWINTAFSVAQPKVGVLGSGGTAKFRGFDNSTGVDSSVDVDTGIHIVEHWCDALSNIYLSFDAESAKTYVTAKNAAVMPISQVYNGATAANRALSIGHFLCITP